MQDKLNAINGPLDLLPGSALGPFRLGESKFLVVPHSGADTRG